MKTRQGHRRAFTLIELLTVITILSLLVATLVPYLSKAREIARRVVCLGNMRSLGSAVLGFAGQHTGRVPGRAHESTVNSSVAWADILNAEYYKADTVQRLVGPVWFPPRKGRILCPSWKVYGGRDAIGAYRYNLDASGGPDWGASPPQGAYGLAVDPAKVNSMYSPGVLDRYNLGARLERFRRPDFLFLLIESEYADSTFMWQFGAPAVPVLNSDPTVPPYAGVGGGLAFRHVLPPLRSLYQDQATACYAYADGHVQIVYPSMGPNDPQHMALDPDLSPY